MVPSGDVATVFPPLPTATHSEPVHATPNPLVLKGLCVTPVHVVPLDDVATVFPPSPTATNNDPFQATSSPLLIKGLVRRVHVIPFGDVAIFPLVPTVATTTHNDNDGLQATPFTRVLLDATVRGFDCNVQSIPFGDVAIGVVLYPDPPATNNDPFQATDAKVRGPIVSSTKVAPRPVHEIPSVDVAIEFPPLLFPTATHNDNDLLHVTPHAP